MTVDLLGARLSRLINKKTADAEIPALTGSVQSDNSIILSDSGLGDNEIYVRLYGNQAMRKVAVNIGVAMRVNLWVGLRQNAQGEYEVARALARENTNTYGTAAASAAQPQVDASFLSSLLVGGVNLLPGRLQPISTGATLTIVVSDFLYLDTAGALRKWTTSSGSLNLTASVPAVSGTHTLALIAFNPSASTPALTVSVLTVRAVSMPFNDSDLPSFTLTAGYLPLATVRLVNGDTALTMDRFGYDVRLFLSPKPLIVLTSGVTGVLPPANGGAGMLFDHYTDVGNSTTTETDLYSDSIPANTLSTNGVKLRSTYAGTIASSATATRQLRVYFGGTLIFDSGALSLSVSGEWTINVFIIRDSASSVRCSVWMNLTGASISAFDNYAVVTGLTLSNAQTFKITGQAAGIGASSNDIVATMGNVSTQPAA